jgi:glycosyltransferase involved in cell wall biosynthesis
VVPFFDLGRYLPETLASVRASGHAPLEVIVVNDASRDPESLRVLAGLRAAATPGLRVLDLPRNVGPAHARLAGAESARGEFLAFVDADDLVDRNFFAQAVRVLRAHENLSLVTSWVRFTGAGSGIWPAFSPELPLLLATNMITALVVVRRSHFLAHGRTVADTRLGLEDWAAWVAMAAAGCAGVSLPEPLVSYRLRADSLSRRFHRDMVIQLFDQIARAHPETYRRHGLELYRLLVANGPGYLWNNPTFAQPAVELRDFLEEGYAGLGDPARRLELVRLANSRLGSLLIRVLFKLRLDRLFK